MTLLIDAFAAYLGPLLKKHAAGELLVWEDLEASHAASKVVLGSSDNFFVVKRVEDLHKSQVQAYQQSAQKALIELVNSVPLEPMEDNDPEESFVERCVSAMGSVKIPNWKLDDLQALVLAEVGRRAKATYAKYHPDEDAEVGDGGEEEEDGEDGEEGEEEDGDDAMGEDGAASGEEAKTAEATAPKKTAVAATATAKKATPGNQKPRVAKGKITVQKKAAAAAKKGTNARGQGVRKGAAATRGRRRPANNAKSSA